MVTDRGEPAKEPRTPGLPWGRRARGWLATSTVMLGLIMASRRPFPTALAQVSDPGAQPTRLYADGFLVWIYAKPERDPSPIGVLRAGQSVALRPIPGTPLGEPFKRGCGRGWFAVEPTGYICVDRQVSLRHTRYSANMAGLHPRAGAFPFEFALSMGTPAYRRVPAEAEWLRKERVFGPPGRRPLPQHWRGHEQLAQDPVLPLDDVPAFLAQGGSVSSSSESRLVRRDVPFGSMVALTGTFTQNGRLFGQSADGTIVPMERLVVFAKSSFQGVDFDAQGQPLHLPLAWTRRAGASHRLSGSADCRLPDQPKGKITTRPAREIPRLPSHCFDEAGPLVAAKTPHRLTGRLVTASESSLAEIIVDANPVWVSLRDLHVAEAMDPPTLAEPSHELWIGFTISQGVLIVYRGSDPIFATLASPGSGGIPAAGADALSTRTTPLGRFRVNFKYRSDDMSPEQTEHRSYFIADVPFAMYFQQPFAIHAAYWHDNFGEPMSGGCINVSPRDGQRLFELTEPRVPSDWYGAGASPELGQGTQIVVRR